MKGSSLTPAINLCSTPSLTLLSLLDLAPVNFMGKEKKQGGKKTSKKRLGHLLSKLFIINQSRFVLQLIAIKSYFLWP